MPAEARGVTFEPALVAELAPGGDRSARRAAAAAVHADRAVRRADGEAASTSPRTRSWAVCPARWSSVPRACLSSLGTAPHEVARQVFLRLVTVCGGRRGHASACAPQRARRARRRSPAAALGARHVRSPPAAQLRSRPGDAEPDGRDLARGVAHRVDAAAGLDRRRTARRRVQRRLAEAMREWIARRARRRVPLARRSARADDRAGSTMTSLQLSGPERAFLDASVAERDREAREMRTASTGRSSPSAARRRRGRQLVGVGLVAVLVAALAVFGTVQWRSAVDAKRDVEDLLAVCRSRHGLGARTRERPGARAAAGDAVRAGDSRPGLRHRGGSRRGALRAAGARCLSTRSIPNTPVAVRAGPSGLVGVYALAPAELMRLAESAVDRRLTDVECRRFLARPCTERADVPIDLELQGGLEAYGARTGADALRGTTVTIASPILERGLGV